jgi:LPXTG-motif cell wall-anchored protein
MKRKTSILLALAIGMAAWASAQLPGGYSNSPTDKSLRLTVVEPLEGATITGKDVRIVLGQPRVPEGQSVQTDKRKDELTPIYQVWVDGKDQGNIPAGQNVYVVRDLSFGPHQLVIAAKNTAGELVDRKEISITTVEAMAGSSSTSTQESTTEPPAAAPPEPAAPPPPEPKPAYTAETEQLPKTGTDYPLMALAGAALLGAGFALRRKV